MISAGVTFYKEKSWFEHIQTVEFMSLIGAGAISMYLGHPNMCNGANLIYEKKAFLKVGGFTGTEHLASGDDEFLMHKLAAHFPNKIHFLKSPKALIKTKAQEHFLSFVNQRKRWASKWNHYQNWSAIALAIFIYGFHIAHLLSIVLIFWAIPYRPLLLALVGGKFILEFLYLRSILTFFGKNQQIKWIPLTEFLYSIYILAIGALGQLGGYQWKNRKLK